MTELSHLLPWQPCLMRAPATQMPWKTFQEEKLIFFSFCLGQQFYCHAFIFGSPKRNQSNERQSSFLPAVHGPGGGAHVPTVWRQLQRSVSWLPVWAPTPWALWRKGGVRSSRRGALFLFFTLSVPPQTPPYTHTCTYTQMCLLSPMWRCCLTRSVSLNEKEEKGKWHLLIRNENFL